MMSEHHRHTDFLRHCLRYDGSSEHDRLEKKIAQIQCDLRCVQRAAWLMAILTGLAVACLAYAAFFADNFPYDTSLLIMKLICAVGIASLISLLAFSGLGLVYRRQLDQRREECRQLVTRLLESRLGQPINPPMSALRDEGASVEINSRSIKIESAAQG